MLPGRVYNAEDILRVLRRRFWLVLVPVAIVSAATALVARGLPNRYRSETLVLVIPQRVPESYVRSTVDSKIQDRLAAIGPLILSRTRLEQIIQEFNLYAGERAHGALMEDLVATMKSTDVKIGTVRTDAFSVSYIGDNPTTVAKVANRLAQLFIDENLDDRTNIAEGTNEFLEQQLAEAKEQLLRTEQRLEGYKREHSVDLPTQIASNLAQVQGARVQISTLSESIDRDQDRKVGLEAQLADLLAASGGTLPAAVPANAIVAMTGPTAKELAQAQDAVKTLELRGYKPGHPDLEAARRKARELETKLDNEIRHPAPQPGTQASPLELERLRRMAEIQAQLKDLAAQMARKEQDLAHAQEMAVQFQTRVDATPTREAELTELTRDYATFQSQYTSLLVKKNDSRIAANLERRQIGEQFRMLDPAKPAERPLSPDRPRINLMGLGAGLVVGLLLAIGFEYRDTTLKTEDDVTSVLGLPVVAVVPTMESAADHRRSVRKRLLLNLALGTTVAGGAAIVAYALLG